MPKQEKPKCLFVATVVKTHINEFHLPYLQMFQAHGYETHVAARDDFALCGEICHIPFCDRFFPLPFQRSPFSRDNLKAYQALKALIESEHYEVIHCHTPVGGILTRFASIAARKQGTKVFYTVHGFHFFRGAPLKNWLLYYPIERIASRWTDVLLTINQEDYQRAKTFPAQQIVYVPGVGVRMEKFAKVQCDVPAKRQELGLASNAFVILMIGELTKRKNQETILKMMARFKGENVYCLFCGQGEWKDKLQEEARQLAIEKQVLFLGFRYDLPQICASSDLFLFPTLHEGLPVALMEAMAAGLPVVCSDVRGNRDLIKVGQGGWLTHPYDIAAMEQAVRALMANPEQRKQMGEWNRQAVAPYDLEEVKEKMRKVYGFDQTERTKE